MKCKRYDECGREVYFDRTGLCLRHEKERRAAEAQPPAPRPRKAAKRASRGRRGTSRTTQARTQTTDVTPES